MKRLALAVVAAATIMVGAGPAWAAQDAPTQLTVTPDSAVVNGEPVAIHVQLRDTNGKPVPDALLRLMVPVFFMGETKNEISGEATTNASGKAVLHFSPAAAGPVEATVTFWGLPGHAASDATVSFDVQRPTPFPHDTTPVGLQAWWAHSQMILIPFIVVWSVYALVVTLAIRVRRAGRSDPEQAATR